MSKIYEKVKKFKKKYPFTIGWRLKAHSKVVEKHLNPGEEVLYAFVAQKSTSIISIMSSYVIVVTNKRIALGQKRLLFGYFFASITPDLFNDLKVNKGLIWGMVEIDTVKEIVELSNIQKSALTEIETNISEYMIEQKKQYGLSSKKEGTL